MLTFDAGTLAPQQFTEGVLTHAAATSYLAATALAASLFIAPLILLPMHDETCALAALLVALGAMAVIAPFPYPLIGYGAAPIIGFGLAFGATRQRAGNRNGNLATA
ncbi:hypothetical protein [Erythrobacter sp. R86502]|uniref:hypothetical protein n=1 Tax=Erythrobacter sp. R86502 TaxID=3093846 RepID=UPI0036D424CF